MIKILPIHKCFYVFFLYYNIQTLIFLNCKQKTNIINYHNQKSGSENT